MYGLRSRFGVWGLRSRLWREGFGFRVWRLQLSIEFRAPGLG